MPLCMNNDHASNVAVMQDVKMLNPSINNFSDALVFEGYAALFDSTDLSGDKIQSTAFEKTLKVRPAEEIKLLYQHNDSIPIGLLLSAKTNDQGLYIEGLLLADIPSVYEVIRLVETGILDGLSIGFKAVRATAGQPGRTLIEIDLWEISLVTFPMHPKTRVTRTQRIRAPDDLNLLISRGTREIRQAIQ